jgi:hypothetical protein
LRVEHVELAIDHRAEIFGLLPAERRRDQDALLVDELDHLRRRHVRVLAQHLEQRHQEHVVDQAALLGHHLLGDLDVRRPAGCDERLPSDVTPPLFCAPGRKSMLDDAVVGGQQHRIGGAVALLEEHGFLRVERLERRQHHLRRAAAVHLARRLVVARRPHRGSAEAAFSSCIRHPPSIDT